MKFTDKLLIGVRKEKYERIDIVELNYSTHKFVTPCTLMEGIMVGSNECVQCKYFLVHFFQDDENELYVDCTGHENEAEIQR